MSPPNVVIAYNPASGSFSQSRLDKLSKAFLAAGYQPNLINSYSEEFIGAVQNSGHVCVVGGDGTLREVIARLRGSSDLPPISVFPAGTINLVAREVLYPAGIEAFVARVTGGQTPRSHYLGELNGHTMLVCASVGPDSLAVSLATTELKRLIGRFAYAVAFGKVLLRWPRPSLTVTANGEEFRCEAAFILKGRYFAGPWQLSVDADQRDPGFQLLLLPRARRRDYLRLIISAAVLPGLSSAHWIRIRTDSVEITGDIALPVQADGDIVSALPIKAHIQKRKVQFA
jgi:diacylglycerol kinase family enzyme